MGCGNAAVTPVPAHPFEGCWQTDNGLEREVWVSDPSGWLFGYSLSRGDTGRITFFEQMRIEVAETGLSLVVIGPKGAIVRFDREPTDNGDADYKFVNAVHDYPQVIAYHPSTGRLDAQISLADGSQVREFKKRACDTP